jgi:excisionase family DNA binding protein
MIQKPLQFERHEQLNLVFDRPLEDTIDVFTASRRAGVSMETIRRWCDEARFPALKLPGRWRIDREEFTDWLRKRHNYFRDSR